VITQMAAAFTLIGVTYVGLNTLAFADDIKRIEEKNAISMTKVISMIQKQTYNFDKLQSIMIHDAIDRAIANPNRTPEQASRLRQLIALGG